MTNPNTFPKKQKEKDTKVPSCCHFHLLFILTKSFMSSSVSINSISSIPCNTQVIEMAQNPIHDPLTSPFSELRRTQKHTKDLHHISSNTSPRTHFLISLFFFLISSKPYSSHFNPPYLFHFSTKFHETLSFSSSPSPLLFPLCCP